VIELVSEIQGVFLVTSNTHGVDRLEPPPRPRSSACRCRHARRHRQAHEQRITDLLRSHPSAPVHFETYEDVIASIGRATSRWPPPPEGRRAVARRARAPQGRPLSASEEAFLREFRKA